MRIKLKKIYNKRSIMESAKRPIRKLLAMKLADVFNLGYKVFLTELKD